MFPVRALALKSFYPPLNILLASYFAYICLVNLRLTFRHVCLRRILLGQSAAGARYGEARHQRLQRSIHGRVARPHTALHQHTRERARNENCRPVTNHR